MGSAEAIRNALSNYLNPLAVDADLTTYIWDFGSQVSLSKVYNLIHEISPNIKDIPTLKLAKDQQLLVLQVFPCQRTSYLIALFQTSLSHFGVVIMTFHLPVMPEQAIIRSADSASLQRHEWMIPYTRKITVDFDYGETQHAVVRFLLPPQDEVGSFDSEARIDPPICKHIRTFGKCSVRCEIYSDRHIRWAR